MGSIEHKPWPKIARLFREMVITEKIDGTNAAVGIQWIDFERDGQPVDPSEVPSDKVLAWVDNPEVPVGAYAVYAQSRKLILTPALLEAKRDNQGFAAWVKANAAELVSALGEGLHYGEWWGSGIERGYGLLRGDKRFSLFNVTRYKDVDFSALPGVGLVPVLYEGPFDTTTVKAMVADLAATGSKAAPGFPDPEGVITFHVASNQVFKTTIENDESPKGK